MFSGQVVTGAIVTDPVTGKSTKYGVKEIPKWVDIVWDGDMICQVYNIAAKNIHGWWNGTGYGANTDCKRTTDDFGYIAKDNDIYIYTGVTSYAGDNSNIGYIMVNSRTGKFSYFKSGGANEQSAMNAAEGEVQQYGYKASFPSLVNVKGNLTYIGVLKDKNNLVKLYYLVNAEDYTKVTIQADREECLTSYLLKLEAKDETKEENSDFISDGEITIQVAKVQYVQEDGNTYVYLIDNQKKIYKSLVSENENILLVEAGDAVTGEIKDGLFVLK